jgi:hypothetical protein
MVRRVVVFDAADLEAESTFWAGMFGGAPVLHRLGAPFSGGGRGVRCRPVWLGEPRLRKDGSRLAKLLYVRGVVLIPGIGAIIGG